MSVTPSCIFYLCKVRAHSTEHGSCSLRRSSDHPERDQLWVKTCECVGCLNVIPVFILWTLLTLYSILNGYTQNDIQEMKPVSLSVSLPAWKSSRGQSTCVVIMYLLVADSTLRQLTLSVWVCLQFHCSSAEPCLWIRLILTLYDSRWSCEASGQPALDWWLLN